MFPETPQTLLKKIADLANGDDAAVWLEFVELYTPPLRHFVRFVDRALPDADAEDAVQDVLIRLVGVLRREGIDRKKGKFRDFLAVMTRRLLIDRYREAVVRPELADEADVELRRNQTDTQISAADPGELVDAVWILAVRKSAIEHVLTKTAVSDQSKRVYRAIVEEQRDLKEVAAAFDLTYAAVKQIKSRLDRAVTAVEQRMR